MRGLREVPAEEASSLLGVRVSDGPPQGCPGLPPGFCGCPGGRGGVVLGRVIGAGMRAPPGGLG